MILGEPNKKAIWMKISLLHWGTGTPQELGSTGITRGVGISLKTHTHTHTHDTVPTLTKFTAAQTYLDCSCLGGDKFERSSVSQVTHLNKF